MCKLDSCSPRDYIKWEEHVEHCIGDFPHTSFHLGAIIEKKIAGTLGMCWSIHVMATKGKFSWEDIKKYFRELLKVPPDYLEHTLDDFVGKVEEHDNAKQANIAVDASVVDVSDNEKNNVVEEEAVIAEISLSISETGEKQVNSFECMGSSFMEESLVDPYVLELEPLPYTPRALDRSRYYYILIPSFNLWYFDLLMGLGGGADYRGYIMPVRSYVVCVGIHWNVSDGFMYWRSILLVGGAIVVQEISCEWKVSQLFPGVNDSDIAIKGDSYCDDEVNYLYDVLDEHYLYSVHWNYVDGWIFCTSYIDPVVKYLNTELLEDYIWGPGWFLEYWDWSVLIFHIWHINNNLGVRYVLSYGYFGRLFIPQDSSGCHVLCCWFCLCYSIILLVWIGVNLGDRGKSKVMSDIHIKHECERNTRVLRAYKHTCEENCLFLISNLFLQIINHLKVLEFLYVCVCVCKYVIFFIKKIRSTIRGSHNLP